MASLTHRDNLTSFTSVVEAASIAHDMLKRGEVYLMIAFQDMENYGSHNWDGTGECPQIWRLKGGTDYINKLSIDIEDDFHRVVNVIKNEIGKAMRVKMQNNDHWLTYPTVMYLSNNPDPNQD